MGQASNLGPTGVQPVPCTPLFAGRGVTGRLESPIGDSSGFGRAGGIVGGEGGHRTTILICSALSHIALFSLIYGSVPCINSFNGVPTYPTENGGKIGGKGQRGQAHRQGRKGAA